MGSGTPLIEAGLGQGPPRALQTTLQLTHTRGVYLDDANMVRAIAAETAPPSAGMPSPARVAASALPATPAA